MLLKRTVVSALFLIVSLIGTSAAFATEAFTTSATWLRTGPDSNFPTIERVPKNSYVEVFGCTDGYSWCDVDIEGERGWLLGSRLQFIYNGRRGSAVNLAPLLGLMILQFSFQDYWDNHYRSRSWYNDQNRQRWQNWQPRYQQRQRNQGPATNPPPAAVGPNRFQGTPQHQQRPAPSAPQPTLPQVQPLQQTPSAPDATPTPVAPPTPNKIAPVAPAVPQSQQQQQRPRQQQAPTERRGPQAPQPGQGTPKKMICVPPEICN